MIAASHVAHHLVLAGLGGIELRNMAAVAQNRDPLRQFEDLIQPVRDVEDGIAFAPKTPNEGKQAIGLARRQGCRRFVENEDAGRSRSGTGDLDQLLLRLAQASGGCIEVDRLIDCVQMARREFAGTVPIDLAQRVDLLGAEQDIFGDSKVGYEADFLWRDGDAGKLGVARRVETDVTAIAQQAAGARRKLAADDVHQGALAGAILADHRMHLTGRDANRHIRKRLDDPEGLGDAARFENRTWHRVLNENGAMCASTSRRSV